MPLFLPLGFLGPSAAYLAPMLLDTLSCTVVGAFSAARPLRAAHGKGAFRARRWSDNDELAIGFSNRLLDTPTLLSFAAGGTASLSVWFDQSAAGQDVIQPVAARQPVVVENGVLVMLGNATARPAVRFSAANATSLANTSFNVQSSDAASVFVAALGGTGSGGRLAVFRDALDSNDYNNASSAIFANFNGSALSSFRAYQTSAAAVGAAPFQGASVYSGGLGRLTVDGTAGGQATVGGPLGSGTLRLGAHDWSGNETGEYWDGPMAEQLIVSGTLSTADQVAIRDDQKTFYGTP